MKKLNLIFIFTAVMSLAHAQKNSDDLPAEFKDVAVQAFAKLSPATKQWFTNTASQHPAGQFNTDWARKKLREKFGVEGADPVMGLFMVMMAYQRLMNKEAREDRKLAGQDMKLELATKEEKLKIDNAKIDQQKKEANEKADNAMTAAQTNLWIGIVSGNSGIASGSLHQTNQKVSTVRLSPAVTQKIDSPITNVRSTVQEKQAADDKETKKPSADQKTATKDAVKKLIDQMALMKSNFNP